MITIKVADYYTRCGVRSKGREFYQKILTLLDASKGDICFDFKGVTYVSASFLDESIFNLLDDYNVSIVERANSIANTVAKIIDWRDLDVRLTSSGGILTFDRI